MKVTLYTTTDCQFCKQEKDYLASKNVTFEEKNVQTNRSFLQEMLDISNNFAGTPVTKIEKDDGKSVVLKGFTQSEFENVFASNVQQANSTIPTPPSDQPVQDQPVSDQPVSTPTPDPAPVVPEPPKPEETPPVVETPSNPDPLPPFPTSNTPTPVQDDTTSEMHSTIPIDPSTTDVPASVPPSTPSDQPQEPVVPEPTEPTPPVETPPIVESPTPTEQPSVNQDQQLNAILDSLKTKAEEPTAPAV